MKKQIVRIQVGGAGNGVQHITQVQCFGEPPQAIEDAVAWASVPGNDFWVAGGILADEVPVEVVGHMPLMTYGQKVRPYLRTKPNGTLDDNLLALERIQPSLASWAIHGLVGGK